MRELLIGCGNSREKRLFLPAENTGWHDLTTLDIDPECKPDIVHDLNVLPYPFDDAEFDEIFAFEVLEHCGKQGDWKFFFDQFTELHRIIKPSGHLFVSVPHWNSPWAWGDPSHTRVIPLESVTFLDQSQYETQVGKTAMSDFRGYYKANWRLVWQHHSFDAIQHFVLKAVK